MNGYIIVFQSIAMGMTDKEKESENTDAARQVESKPVSNICVILLYV